MLNHICECILDPIFVRINKAFVYFSAIVLAN